MSEDGQDAAGSDLSSTRVNTNFIPGFQNVQRTQRSIGQGDIRVGVEAAGLYKQKHSQLFPSLSRLRTWWRFSRCLCRWAFLGRGGGRRGRSRSCCCGTLRGEGHLDWENDVCRGEINDNIRQKKR